MKRSLLAVGAILLLCTGAFAQTTTTGTITPTTFCAGAAVNVPFTSTGTYNAGNIYRAELSNAAGVFTGAVIGTLASTANSGTIAATIPFTQAAGTVYRIRVTSTNPVAVVANQNTANLTVTALSISTPTLGASTFCPGQTGVAINFTIPCTFPNTPANNIFTAQLSDAAGAFGSPVDIGTVTTNTSGSITAAIPSGTTSGNAYRIRIVSSNPTPIVTSPVSAAITIGYTIGTPTLGAATFCPGQSGINVTYTVPGAGCVFPDTPANNVFTAELSDAAGAFGSPVTIGNVTANSGGTIAVAIPAGTTPGSGYRIRIVSSNGGPATSPISASLTIAYSIGTPTLGASTFCPGQTGVNVSYTITSGCDFPNTPSANVFTAELSDAAGAFGSPVTIGTLTSNTSGTISTTIPAGTAPGAGYRIRIRSSNPGAGVTSGNSASLTLAYGLGTPTVSATTFCPGTTGLTVTFASTGGCAFPNTPSNNVFTAELSDAAGAFGSPTAIGTLTSPNAGVINITIPSTLASGSAYRIRVRSSNPGAGATSGNSAALTVPAFGINTPTVSATSICPGIGFNITFALNGGCALPDTPANVFTAELSDAAGAFGSPVSIGTLTSAAGGTIAATMPAGQAAGTGYRVRVRSSNPGAGLTSAANTANITVPTYSINTPTISATTLCPGQTSASVTFTLNGGCNFPNTPTANTWTVELSDAFGTFAATPPVIGTVTNTTGNTIFVTIPVNSPAGNGYRVRVKSTNPTGGLTSPPNTTNLTINGLNMNAPTTGATTYCAGASFNVAYTLVSGCNFLAGNVFTAEISDASGSFAAAQAVGTANATNGGNIGVTLPQTLPAGTAYRFRVRSSNPAITSPTSGSDITINQFGINAPTVGSSSLCQGQAVTVAYTLVNTCTLPNTPSNNVFTAQLSNASGSFAAPVDIGTLTSNSAGTINATIPVGTAGGTGYRIRVVSSNPSGSPVISANNGSDITVVATPGNPSTYGTTAWNAYVYAGTTFPITSNVYFGMYTENNLNFATTNRWAAANGPGVADNTSGSAYSGCALAVTNYSVSFKRTNFTCGYYQLDIPSHDDDMRLFVNGVLVFSHVGGCCDAHTNAWTGFLGPTSQVDIQFINFGGPGNLTFQMNAATNPLVVTPTATTICSTSSASLSVSGLSGVTYSWTPTTGLTPASGLGATVSASPGATTTYTAHAADPTSGCELTRTAVVNVVSAATVPTVTITPNTTQTICSGVTTSTLTASGANTYTWAPTTGLTPTTGNIVTANPATNTTYTVTGSTGCQSNTASVTVNVQNLPAGPAQTVFGNNTWNVFNHNNTTFSNYYGYYAETSLSFNTTTKWNTTTGPSVGNVAYTGCTLGGTNYSQVYKRTNFTCGYYRVDVNYQDDQFTLIVDGVQVFQNNAFTATLQTGVWAGFLGPASQVEMRLVNASGPGRLDVSFVPGVAGPQTLSANVTICAGTNTNLTSSAAAYPSATFAWSVSPSTPTITFSPSANVANPTMQTTGATPANTYTVTNTMTDAGGTGCTADKTLSVIVNPLPTTAVTPTSATIICTTQTVTLTATGANTYTWAPAAGLNQATGNIVIAQPTTTTTYTVTGNNNCASNDATSTITVIPLPATSTFPTNRWNVYGFDSQTIGTNYQGYYTENGTGSPAYSFNTTTRWASGAAPSGANATNGNAWVGCTMSATNISLSFKRSGFACGIYQIDVPQHDDNVLLFINGVQVAQHIGCCDVHTNFWTGSLTASSTVEFQLVQGGGSSYLQATFTQIAQPAGTTVWVGGTDNDWFNAANWCPSIPTSTLDAVIPAGPTAGMPQITGAGAQVRNITLSAQIPAGGTQNLTPAASLTFNGAFNLDVFGNWSNSGTLNAGTGTVTFTGTGTGLTIGGTATETFNNVVLNRTNATTITLGGARQIAGTLTMTNGLVTQNGTLRFLAGSSVAGASNTSYVDGAVAKVGNTAFTFPVGKGGLYRPMGISAPTNVTDAYTAQYFNTNPTVTWPNANRSITLDHVSGAEYWNLTRTAGSSSVNPTLSWNTNSGGVGNLPTLRVAVWNGSLWSDLGNSGTTGNTTSGTVTSQTATTLSGSFTLATSDNGNALPVQLKDLKCNINAFGNPEMVWVTASEMNSDHFDVERSSDGRSFESVAKIISKGFSDTDQMYSFEDLNAPAGRVYYRLKQVDRDGRTSVYEACAMDVEDSGLSAYPNPTSNTASIHLHGSQLQDLTVTSTIGQVMNVAYQVKENVVIVDMSSLASGVYFVRITADQKSGILKLLKQ